MFKGKESKETLLFQILPEEVAHYFAPFYSIPMSKYYFGGCYIEFCSRLFYYQVYV